MLFNSLDPSSLAIALDVALTRRWDHDMIRAHAARFSEEQFVAKLRALADAEFNGQQTPTPALPVGRSGMT
jgi:hypothetical protein